jgi:sugar transferase (PEP-CTERM system associated)
MKVLGHYVYWPIALLAAVEFALSAGAFASLNLVFEPRGWEPRSTYWPLIAVGFGAATFLGLTAMGLYQAKQRLRIEGVLARVILGLGIAAVGLALVNFVLPLGIGGPLWISSFALTAVLLSATRTVLWRWFEHDVFRRRVLIFGAGKRAASLNKLRRRSDRRGFTLVGFVHTEGDDGSVGGEQLIELKGSLLEYALANGVDEIVVAMDDRRVGFPIGDLLDCKFAGVAVIDLLSFLERETGKVNVDLVNPSWLIFSEGFSVRAYVQVVSRIVDVVAALVLLSVAAPLMLLVALAILLDDGRPILYGQTRVGLMGKTFTIYKFRSMIKDAEAGGRPQWAQTGDGRVTRVGAIIRKLRLDELPQLLNVLAGAMSLVGPRPERPEFVARLSRHIPYYHERHVVKPGITGWAQLSYPYGASDQDALEKLQFDLYYIKHKSLIFDVMVLLQTAEVVLWGKGAR